MKTLSILFALLTSATLFAQNTYGDIIGTLVDDHQQGIYGAYVKTTNGSAVFQAVTDPDGHFRISAVPPGKYILIFKQDTVEMIASREVEVLPDGFGDIGVITFSNSITLEEAEVDGNRLRLTRGVAPEIKLSRKEIAKNTSKFDIKGLVTTMTSDVRATDDGSLVFRGARKGDLVYYIDGVKMGATANVPSASMGYVMVYSGAIPAKYGDTNGGVIVVETISYNDLYRDWMKAMGH